ncbi:Alpha/Beta hydrolase protein [Phaeosphaeriaceae sp. PMI808]|nr:Alpha/Beta hydrolase protein [Phaeosphaeriaceae sp. PMI808]
MAPIWSYQPLKCFWTAWIIGVAPLYFSILSLCYTMRRFRPHPNWSFRTSLARALYYQAFKYMAKIRMAPIYAVKSRGLNERFVMVKPASSDVYAGVLKHPTIKPVPFGAIWFPRPPTAQDILERKFVLHLPGGAYVIASPPDSSGEFPSSVYMQEIEAITFYAQYRVAATPESQFPAAIQDAVTFYSYLLDLGIPSKNIIVSGDSAGGNLVIALLRYIEDSKTLLPRPRGAVAWSPWVNVTANAISTYQASPLNSTDLVPYQILEWGLEAYPLPANQNSSEAQAYVSPAQHPFNTTTPLFLQAGSVEVFRDDICSFAQEMAAVPGNRVRYFETAHAPHDIILCGGLLGLEKEARNAIKAADVFFQLSY